MVTAATGGAGDLDDHPGSGTTCAAPRRVAVVGAGPAGLMAAEVLARAGCAVTLYERMPSPARKFLMAGRGGLNLTHSEPLEQFLGRYGATRPLVEDAIRAYPPSAVTAWSAGLGQQTFNGSSGRVFPKALKASPLLRAWLERLGGLGVQLQRGWTWTGWDQEGALAFVDQGGGAHCVTTDATLLALGGASWPRLGADGSWVSILAAAGIPVTALAPSNSGVLVAWSDIFAARFAGSPLKRIAISLGAQRVRGEAVVTRAGLEGGAVYALSAPIRAALAAAAGAPVEVTLDLRPDQSVGEIEKRLSMSRGKQSATTFLRKALHLSPVDIGLLREAAGKALPADAATLARLVKAAAIPVRGMAGLERAISTAGGVHGDAVDRHFMLRRKPGVFVAGEMLDWDAPTGGYLLQATLSTAVAAANGIVAWLADADVSRGRRDGS